MQQEKQTDPVYTKKWIKAPPNTSITMFCKENLDILDQSMPNVFTLDIV